MWTRRDAREAARRTTYDSACSGCSNYAAYAAITNQSSHRAAEAKSHNCGEGC